MGFGTRWRAWFGLGASDLPQFAALVRRRMEDRGEAVRWQPGEDLLRIEGHPPRAIPLRRAFEAYRAAAPRERDRLIERITAPPPEAPDRETALAGLRPAIRNRYRYENELRRAARQWTDARPQLPPSKPLAENLALCLALDEPSTVSLVGGEQLRAWGLDFEEALERACTNLRAASDDDWNEVSPGLFASPWGDYHDPARLCLQDIFHRLPLAGAPVAAVPNRHVALVCGDRNLDALGHMLEATRCLLSSGPALSSIPVRLEHGAWHSFAPDQAHPELSGFSALRSAEITGAYRLQAELQTSEPPMAEVLPVVAAGQAATGCLWTEAPNLVPTVDYLLLEPGPGPVPALAFSLARERLPDCLQRTEHWPPRWLGSGPPPPLPPEIVEVLP